MTRTLLRLVLVGLFVCGSTAYAHHSMAAQYDTGKQVKLEGPLVQFQFRNPHSFVHIEAPDENGQIQRWAVEWGGASSLAGQGLTRTTLKVGDVVVIMGNPSRTPDDHKLLMKSLMRTSDGFGWGFKAGQVVD